MSHDHILFPKRTTDRLQSATLFLMKGQPNRRTARNIIGARVAKARMDKNPPLSQESLSEMLDNSGTAISRSMIAKIETGGRCVYDYEAVALARALNVDVRWLLGGRS